MARAVAAVIAFVESPANDCSRDWPLDTLLEVLVEFSAALPDLGVAPTALLLSALQRGATEGEPSPSASVSVDEWMSVRMPVFAGM